MAERMAAQRRPTLYFLRHTRRAAPVFLDTDVDMTSASTEYSPIVHVLAAAGRVLPKYPDCLVAAGGGLVPRIARFAEVRPKIAMDRTVDGQRVVVSTVLPDLRDLGKAEIRDRLAAAREAPVGRNTELLYRLPSRIGWFGFRRALSTVHNRDGLLGTIAVSSLGHRSVNGFHAHGGTAITLNLGQVRPTPVVRDGAVAVAPVLRLNLCFDHRVVDGAQAADLLADLREDLEARA
ncbi:MAG: 2-oxo acid dehydrogenase subunit E2 [Kibdelosporangium sp.]